MPTVNVVNGNLEDALAVFKRKSQAEGIIKLLFYIQSILPTKRYTISIS